MVAYRQIDEGTSSMSTDEKRSAVGDLLFEHHMLYQQKTRRVVTQKQFAEYCGLGDQKYNHIYKGKRKASLEVIRQLAEFFEDIRFYEAGGYQAPDPRLHLVQSTWKDLPNGIAKQIADIVGDYKAGRRK
jgi:transcriptional regulator with XRE-family HTH domain